MVKNIKLVIGANFGDCGKGLMTDYFCHQAISKGENCIVVLYNGGAQRGHTVKTPDGIRHVFHHFGSGTFVGAYTYCSEEFILNPMVFRQEWEELEVLGYKPVVYVNANCRVSTPYDMIINQLVEESRSQNRHGSCGMGIYETIQRYKSGFGNNSFLKIALDRSKQCLLNEQIRENYFAYRLKELGLSLDDEWRDIFYSPGLLENYVDDLLFMDSHTIKTDDFILEAYNNIIFEGGQGLLLDQNNKEYFPHLTPSNTGSTNPYKIISERFSDADNIEVCYVTRTYLTRHGAGRLDNECAKEEINPYMQDLTNVPNLHQGTLRYAEIDVKELNKRINHDFAQMKNLNAKCSLAITHSNEYAKSDWTDIDFDCKFYGSFGEDRKSVFSYGCNI